MNAAEPFDPLEEFVTGKSHPIIEACKDGDHETFTGILANFLANEKPLTVQDYSGWQAVHYAAKLTDTSILSTLLKQDETLVHSRTRENITPLMVAAGLSNVEASRVILSQVDDEDVEYKNIHDLNALYYAILANTPDGNKVAIALIEHSKNIVHDFIDLLAMVIENKNEDILKAMLVAGVTPQYTGPAIEERLTGHDWASSHNAAGLCVHHCWTSGLRILIEAEKNKMKNSKIDYSKLCDMFLTVSDYSRSAWKLASKVSDCRKLMLDEGLLSLQSNKNCDKDGLKFPLHRGLPGTAWKNLSFRSCQNYNEFYRATVLHYYAKEFPDKHLGKFEKLSRVMVMDDDIGGTVNVDIIEMLEEFSECPAYMLDNSINETIETLLDCGFSFDFEYATYIGESANWLNSVAKLVFEAQRNPKVFQIVINLLNRPLHLPLTMNALCYSLDIPCQHNFKEPDTYWPHLFLLKMLSYRPLSEITRAYDSMHVEMSALISRQLFENSKFDREDFSDEGFPASNVIQLILKGVKVRLADGDSLNLWFQHPSLPKVPFSTLILSDDERGKFFLHDHTRRALDDPFEQKCMQERISSLQSLSRAVIREKIGFSRLIREPVPRLEHGIIDVDESWEVSSIAKLPIPTILHDFIRFTDEIVEFYEYMERFQTRHGNVGR